MTMKPVSLANTVHHTCMSVPNLIFICHGKKKQNTILLFYKNDLLLVMSNGKNVLGQFPHKQFLVCRQIALIQIKENYK